MTLIFNILTPNAYHLFDVRCPAVILCTKLQYPDIIYLWGMVRTNKQTLLNVTPTPADSDGVGKKHKEVQTEYTKRY